MTDEKEDEMLSDAEIKAKLSDTLSEAFGQLKASIGVLPPSRSFSIVMTKIDEAEMWTKKGLAELK